jgi:hypothetical protein
MYSNIPIQDLIISIEKLCNQHNIDPAQKAEIITSHHHSQLLPLPKLNIHKKKVSPWEPQHPPYLPKYTYKT